MFQTIRRFTPVRGRRLDECDVHQVLSNARRRETLRLLTRGSGTMSLRELSELVAAVETGETPAPRNVREAVYNSLHQLHLPRLDELDVLSYDADRKHVALLDGARDVTIYMEVVTPQGITWAEFYRGLGVLGLTAVVASTASVPGIDRLPPLLWASGFLALYAGTTAYQLWTHRRGLLKTLLGR